jgi:hypothetical protein
MSYKSEVMNIHVQLRSTWNVLQGMHDHLKNRYIKLTYSLYSRHNLNGSFIVIGVEYGCSSGGRHRPTFNTEYKP